MSSSAHTLAPTCQDWISAWHRSWDCDHRCGARCSLYLSGCSSGAAALHVEQPWRARPRCVCGAHSDAVPFTRRGKHRHVNHAGLIWRWAGPVVVGADPVSVEQADFELVLAFTEQQDSREQAPTPPSAGSARTACCSIPPGRSQGWYVRENIHQCVADALAPLGIS